MRSSLSVRHGPASGRPQRNQNRSLADTSSIREQSIGCHPNSAIESDRMDRAPTLRASATQLPEEGKPPVSRSPQHPLRIESDASACRAIPGTGDAETQRRKRPAQQGHLKRSEKISNLCLNVVESGQTYFRIPRIHKNPAVPRPRQRGSSRLGDRALTIRSAGCSASGSGASSRYFGPDPAPSVP